MQNNSNINTEMTTSTKTPTVREIRQRLFTYDSKEADALRRILFHVEDQDAPASADYLILLGAVEALLPVNMHCRFAK